MGTSLRLVDHVHPVQAFAAAVPSSANPAYVNLAEYNHVTIVIEVVNASTVTGSAVTLLQATNVSAGSAKALAFSTVYVNADTGAGDALTATAVVSNTFTTQAVNSKKSLYIIEVDAAELDQANGFQCLQVGLGNAVSSTLAVTYYLSGARVGGGVANFPTAIV